MKFLIDAHLPAIAIALQSHTLVELDRQRLPIIA